ncbi:MAG: zinc ABC transporter solute-binding protein, partial [Planctomycetes bacterium]|nr:zinc ABC transporter solute-binding protein [Planctomycetota bacterium]
MNTSVPLRNRCSSRFGAALLAACAFIAAGPAGCGGAEAGTPASSARGPAAGNKWNIVCTVGMVADIVRAVAGERATVANIIGEGVDPHLYTTTRSDVSRLRSADIVFYSGLMLEGKMADALVRVARTGKPVYAVTELVDERYLLQPKAFAGHFDPHVWMDVRGWMKAVQA